MCPASVSPAVPVVDERRSSVVALFEAPDSFGQTEIQQLHPALRRDFDIGWLQIAVDDALAMRRFQRLCNLTCIVKRRIDRYWTNEHLAIDQFKDQIVDVARLLQAVDDRNIG